MGKIEKDHTTKDDTQHKKTKGWPTRNPGSQERVNISSSTCGTRRDAYSSTNPKIRLIR